MWNPDIDHTLFHVCSHMKRGSATDLERAAEVSELLSKDHEYVPIPTLSVLNSCLTTLALIGTLAKNAAHILNLWEEG